jgi:hypothetical protein
MAERKQSTPAGLARTARGRAAVERNAAVRALSDPRKLARAKRIIQYALVEQILTVDDLTRLDS